VEFVWGPLGVVSRGARHRLFASHAFGAIMLSGITLGRGGMSSNELGAGGARGSRRIARRITILVVFAAILAALFAWNALLVYAITRIVGVVS
jgi:hypothetical protein